MSREEVGLADLSIVGEGAAASATPSSPGQSTSTSCDEQAAPPRNLSFDIALNPIPLGRPQFVRRGNHHMTIMPARSLEWRESFRTLLALQLPREPVEGPLVVQMWFWRQCRSSVDRGDLSNLIKAVEDACNPDKRTGWPGLWKDDRQIEILYAAIIESGPNVDGRLTLLVADKRPPGRMFPDEGGALLVDEGRLG